MDELSKEKNDLRKEKDREIRNLADESEAQRDRFEREINQLEKELKCNPFFRDLTLFIVFKSQTLELKTTIIELKEVITQKDDVEN